MTVTPDMRFIVSSSEKAIKVFDFDAKKEFYNFSNDQSKSLNNKASYPLRHDFNGCCDI